MKSRPLCLLTLLALSASAPAAGRPGAKGLATRSETIAPHAMACTSQPLATQVALDMLKQGGSAVDAAIAANATLGLMEPTGNGIGGDLFAIVWDAPSQRLHGLNGRSWGVSFTGREGTLILNDSGYEVISEPKRKSLESKKYPSSGDPRPAHVRNFLDCVESRQEPVENIKLGHHVSGVAHLGNVALRCGRKINWDPDKEQIIGDHEANRLVSVPYRSAWKLPYMPGGYLD